MMILVLTAPPVCILGVFAIAFSKGVQKVEQDKRATIANLVLEEVSGSRDGSYMYLKGLKSVRIIAFTFFLDCSVPKTAYGRTRTFDRLVPAVQGFG
jgi:hypothetical protein